MLLTEWSDAEGRTWISDEMTDRVEDPSEKAMLSKYHLANQHGKGSRRMVPILIPVNMTKERKSTISEMRKLASLLDGSKPGII